MEKGRQKWGRVFSTERKSTCEGPEVRESNMTNFPTRNSWCKKEREHGSSS